MDPNRTENTPSPEQPPVAAQPTPQPPNNKKLIIGIAIGLGALLVVLIVLIGVLIMQRSNDASQTNSHQTEEQKNEGSENRKVVKTLTFGNKSVLEMTVYEPKQTASNTRIEYSIKNICTSSCQAQEYVSSYNVGVINATDSSAYLLDDASGTKYNPIIDSNNKPLASECNAFLEPGEKKECFASFTKVPDGTPFSLVFRSVKVDGLTAK